MARPHPASRVVETGALAAVAPVLALVPVWLLALAVLWVPVHWVWPISFWTFALLHLALGGLLFLRPVQRVVLARLMGIRRPRPDELDLLEPAWRRVTRAIGAKPNRFVLMVVDSDDINAFACGGHLLVVSSFAVESLPTDELSGVLAHELSHHLGSHTVALTIGQWLSLPILLLARVGFSLQNVAQAATETLMRGSRVLVSIGQVVGALLTAMSWVFLSGLIMSNAIGNVVSRGAEFQADRRAVGMGFGRELSRALRRVVAAGHAPRPTGTVERLRASHPPARTRVARIDALLRSGQHPSTRWPPPSRQTGSRQDGGAGPR